MLPVLVGFAVTHHATPINQYQKDETCFWFPIFPGNYGGWFGSTLHHHGVSTLEIIGFTSVFNWFLGFRWPIHSMIIWVGHITIATKSPLIPRSPDISHNKPPHFPGELWNISPAYGPFGPNLGHLGCHGRSAPLMWMVLLIWRWRMRPGGLLWNHPSFGVASETAPHGDTWWDDNQ